MAYDEALAERLRQAVAAQPGITTRKMFGGFVVMRQGNMLAGVIGDDLMVRVGPHAQQERLAEPDAQPLRFGSREPKGMLLVDGASVAAEDRLERWVGWAVDFVATLPPK